MRNSDARHRRRSSPILVAALSVLACSTEPAPKYQPVEAAPAGKRPAAAANGAAGQRPVPAISAKELPPDAQRVPEVEVELLPVPEARVIKLEPPSVELAAAGAEPRAQLRLAPKTKTTANIELVMKMTMGMRVGPKDVAPTVLPEIRVGMQTAVEKLSRDNIEYSFAVTSVERQANAEVSTRVLDAVDRAVTGMRETKGRMTLDRTGRVEQSTLGLPDLSSPGLRPSLSGFTQSFAQLYPVFPKEAVGVGASWVSTEQFELSGIPVQQKTTYTLRSNEDSVLKLDVVFEQAALGKVKSPDQLDMAVTAFGGEGKGTITFDLRGVVPQEASSSSATQTSSTVTLGTGGEGVRMDLLLDLSITRP